MASEAQVQRAEKIIGYKFTSSNYLRQALTAAGAEKDNHEGNRPLAHIGAHWIDTLLMIVLMSVGASKVLRAQVRIDFTRKDHFKFAAKRTGISQCIKYSSQGGEDSSTVLRYAINAIIGAVLLDTDTQSITTTLGALQKFSFGLAAMEESVHSQTPEMPALPAPDELDVLGIDDEIMNPTFNVPLELLPPPIPESDQMSDGHRTGVPGSSEAEAQLADNELATTFMLDYPVSMDITTLDYTGDIPTESQRSQFTWDMSSFQVAPDHESTSVSTIIPPTHLPQRSLPAEPTHAQGSAKMRGKRVKTSPYASISDTSQQLLNEDRTKCVSQHLPPPEETYFALEIQAEVLKPTHESIEPLLPLIITIASPSAILSLRGMIRNARAQPSFHSYRLQDGLSQANRFMLIEKLEDSASTIGLMRWYHIWELFRHCGGPNTVSSSGYANITPATFFMGQKYLGNPVHHDDAKISESMMKDIFPDIEPSSEEYKKHMRRIKRLRKLGQRLHALIEKFGKGVLGLLVGQTSSGGLDIPVSDTMLLKPIDKAFSSFISLLEASQGDSLRAFGNAVWGVLRPVLFGMLSESASHIESITPEEILRHVKGSSGLLELIR
ncbi:hypothetical protein BO94DRAFT_615907 [Aspergillus sclerotioniger CBS 115572]|uniref:RNase III domain-containing protein n=1 Tax=Aspergillus sclerotioniger CBS 115572 TaxID=1450535 RepID=A0A317X956_9EURO|nr:hypothetical protein BO94DRAFT_615907 [Aspergillus sclerotioniger CBS 115572]PWY93090.1 hypothetical protein BO94DRAFT_615907 [Aspergillus sclerotioniger CBS 115572]